MPTVQIEIEQKEIEDYIEILREIQSLLEFMVEMIKEQDGWEGGYNRNDIPEI